jgi:WhiB family redox-sensing transcriptional regulator
MSAIDLRAAIPEWMESAACAHADPERWFPDDRATTIYAKAVAICRQCPVAAQCFEHSMTARLPNGAWLDGIYAGTTPRQRGQLRRRLREQRERRAS